MNCIPDKTASDCVVPSEFNSIKNETLNAIVEQGKTCTAANQSQLSETIQENAVNGDFYTSVFDGTNTYNLTQIQNNINPKTNRITSYFDGMRIRFEVDVLNSAQTYLNVSGLGSKELVNNDGRSLISTDVLSVGKEINAIYYSNIDKFKFAEAQDTISTLSVDYFSKRFITGFDYYSAGGANINLNYFGGSFGKVSACFSQNTNKYIESSINLPKTISSWVEGANGGIIATGVTISLDVNYFLFVMSKDDGTIDYILDDTQAGLHIIATAGASGYTNFRVIGAVLGVNATSIYSTKAVSEDNIVKISTNPRLVYDATIDMSSPEHTIYYSPITSIVSNEEMFIGFKMHFAIDYLDISYTSGVVLPYGIEITSDLGVYLERMNYNIEGLGVPGNYATEAALRISNFEFSSAGFLPEGGFNIKAFTYSDSISPSIATHRFRYYLIGYLFDRSTIH